MVTSYDGGESKKPPMDRTARLGGMGCRLRKIHRWNRLTVSDLRELSRNNFAFPWENTVPSWKYLWTPL